MQEILYDKIGPAYDSTRKADPFLVSRLRALLEPVVGKRYLDIGCGTGNYTIALKEKGIDIDGLDPSEKMLQSARLKNGNIQWLKGNSENIPLDDQAVGGAIAILTIHHWNNIKHSFKEINRVLNKNGRIVFFTSAPEQMKGYWLNYYFPIMLEASIKKMPSQDVISEALQEANFEIMNTEKYFVADDLADHFLYVGKNRPALYFDAAIRSGISSFASLSNDEEVNKGLAALANDIENNRFPGIKQQYENQSGDYIFVVADKKN